MKNFQDRFWETKTLNDMSVEEWEALCDGCGRCCLVKLEDEDSGEVAFTDVSCQLLDTESCRCRDYRNRLDKVPDCVRLTRRNIEAIEWLPRTCAYRTLRDGNPLPSWHPLVSGDPESVHAAGLSVRHRVVPESRVAMAELEDHIIVWVD